MDFLAKEIEKKRKALAASTNGNGDGKKYFKRSELERHREEEYLREQEERERKRRKRSESQEKENSVEPVSKPSTSKGNGTSTPVGEAAPEGLKEVFNISNEEAIRRLRLKGQPIRLFGESDKERRLRLRALQLIEERSEGQRNDFMRTLEGLDQAADLEGVSKARATQDKESKSKDDSNGGGEGKDGKPGQEEDVLVDLSLIKTNPSKIYPQIYFALKRVLKEWEQSMAERPDHVKRSTQGKLASATQMQSAEYLKPLFKSLRKRELQPDVLLAVAEIVHYMQKREYIKANDSYLRLSIGNAPWPIGVTMVGIHERSAREKIFSNSVAHVLNDEVSRKYIQSLKRLLTFAQTIRPPADLAMRMG